MLTLFTIPKAFRNEFGSIQQNAIRSWAALRPACQILLVGNDEGTREVAAETGALHIPAVERNELGTPLLNSVFLQAERYASSSHLCYVNADIVLLSDFLPAIEEVYAWNASSLIVGRRRDLDLKEPLAFGETGWEQLFLDRINRESRLHEITGLDYFVFPHSFWGELPPFAIGRGLWDEWLLYRARTRGAAVVDATERITAVHQNHSYGHHPGGERGVWHGLETQRNMILGGGLRHAYTLRDATHHLRRRGVRRRAIPFDLRRCFIQPITTNRFVQPLLQAGKALLPGPQPEAREERPRV
jgi:hypothetical protein